MVQAGERHGGVVEADIGALVKEMAVVTALHIRSDERLHLILGEAEALDALLYQTLSCEAGRYVLSAV
ncbi:MAG: hypothetical protein LBK00_09050 [Treponema sp.]|nr:hypothetical protein [Treponema sp.]